ncbi:G-rich sequence factor 1 isoform X2 [Esox lucius]|uniref:G-rich sequence factor 1 isoform X2 n=1 Tax=Esox lucius TaxID=8010 RepID=UPI001476EEDA|nr:G-rich sequence factor 1 isoform X2 [Esox lucius]
MPCPCSECCSNIILCPCSECCSNIIPCPCSECCSNIILCPCSECCSNIIPCPCSECCSNIIPCPCSECCSNIIPCPCSECCSNIIPCPCSECCSNIMPCPCSECCSNIMPCPCSECCSNIIPCPCSECCSNIILCPCSECCSNIIPCPCSECCSNIIPCPCSECCSNIIPCPCSECCSNIIPCPCSECRVRDGVKGIHLTVNRDGKPNGQAFIELENEEDVSKALEKHRQYLGRRYIEVSEVTNSDAEAILKKTIQLPAKDGVVRLRGLPYSCTETDILLFFAGLDVAEDGVTLTTDYRGRKTGEAYVQFLTQEQADQALTKDRELIGNRYIEVFPSNRNEIGGRRKAEAVEDGRVSRPSQPDRAVVQPREPRQTDRHASPMSSHHFVHMRGLPYSATGQDIAQFFYPLALSKILLEFGPDGKATGEGEVYFTSHEDAIAAMTRDKAHMQERYIELFLNSAGPTEGE